MMKKKLLVLVLAFAVFALCACGSSGEKAASADSAGKKKTQVTIGYLPITHALALFEEKEMLDAEEGDLGINLQKFSSWADLTDALNAGKIDGASMLIELAMGAKENGVDIRAVALGHRSGNVIVVSDKITAVSDLKGKTIAIPAAQSSHNILIREMLKNAGLSDSDVKITQLSPPEMPSSLASGAIDAYCVAEPFGAQAVVGGYGKVLYRSDDLWPDSICCALVLQNSFLTKNPETAASFIENYKKAGAALDSDTAEKTAEKYLGSDADTIKESLNWISFDNLEITQEDYQGLSDKMKEFNISDKIPAYQDFVWEEK